MDMHETSHKFPQNRSRAVGCAARVIFLMLTYQSGCNTPAGNEDADTGARAGVESGSPTVANAQVPNDATALSEPDVDESRQSSMVQRDRRPGNRPPRPPRPPGPNAQPAQFPQEFRSIDGAGNNVNNPEWGAAGVALRRLAAATYADGVGTPAGADRPSAREVSNLIVAQSDSLENARGTSDYLWQWGQFLDHDIDETPVASPTEEFDIVVPTGDPWFDPDGEGDVTIALDRSAYAFVDGVREQFNEITAFIDASNVYGSDEERAQALRMLDGTGKLRTSDGNLLPFNDVGLENAPAASSNFFLAGDIRANEQVGLTAMHTLFVREHNHWVDEIAALEPDLTGDELYERARAIVAAEMQAITYREFLPLLLGRRALPIYRGYRPAVDPSISNEFATAAYRVGHSMLSPTLLRVDAVGNEIASRHLSLASAFFNPQATIDEGIDPVLRGLAEQYSQEIDSYIIDEVRNFLFGAPGAGGFDLASLNIQRGRDHGLPSLNEMRVALGLNAYTSFDQINDNAEAQASLAAAYDSVDDIDLWVGGLAETHATGALVGQTWRIILTDQFVRLRDGDRFWYQVYLPRDMVQMVEQQNLARIIRRNTDIGEELSDNVFVVAE